MVSNGEIDVEGLVENVVLAIAWEEGMKKGGYLALLLEAVGS